MSYSDKSLLQTALLSSKLSSAAIHRRTLPASPDFPASSSHSLPDVEGLRLDGETEGEDDEDELIGVQTRGLVTPEEKRVLGRSGLSSNGNGEARGPLIRKLGTDPLKAFPSEISAFHLLAVSGRKSEREEKEGS